ncbi:MAG: DMT family transporter [Thermodesulfobacteriota bacterium]|nr:DMT family transporter [Thermodesulfobacteriota bacterium]
MTWFFLSLVTALCVAVRDTSVKIFCRDLKLQEIAAFELFWSLPILIIGCLFIDIPVLDQTFWWTFFLSLPLNWLAYILYLYSLKLSPLSLTVPFLAFTPLFILLTGSLILNETINSWGITGVGLIVGGSYLLNFSSLKKGLLKPFKSILQEKGSLLMLGVAFIFSFAAVVGKKSMIHSSPLFFTFFFFLIFNITLLFGLFLFKQTNWSSIIQNRRKGLLLGSLLTTHVVCHGLAIMLTTAVYMITVKRSSILFSIILSSFILKETNIRSRGLGALLMFCGALLIGLFG